MKKKIINFIKNKYFIASLAFFVWVGFVDSDHNFFRHAQLNKDLKELHKLQKYYNEQIEYNKNLAYKLESDIDYLEKFAREEYGMKRDNEIVYVIIPD